MKNFFKYLIIPIFIFTSCYIASSIYNYSGHKLWIYITLENNASYDITSVSVETSHHNTFQYNKIIKQNASITFPIYFYGAGTYSMQVVMEDGTIHVSGNGYIESGSTSKHWITDRGLFNIFTISKHQYTN